MSAQSTTQPSPWKLKAVLITALCVMTVSAFLSGAGLATYVVSSNVGGGAAITDQAAAAQDTTVSDSAMAPDEDAVAEGPMQAASAETSGSGTQSPSYAGPSPTPAEIGTSALEVSPVTGQTSAPTTTAMAPPAPSSNANAPVADRPAATASLPESPLPAPNLFTVQVASFTNPANADALAARLTAMGLAPTVAPVVRGETAWTIVSLGPFRTGAQAASAGNTVRLALGIEPIVRTLPGGPS